MVFLYRKSNAYEGRLEFATKLGLSGWAMQEVVEFGFTSLLSVGLHFYSLVG